MSLACPRHLKGLLFDLDGVVADTEDLHRQAYNLAFEEAGLETRWSFSDYKQSFHLSAGGKLHQIQISKGLKEDPDHFRKRLYERKRSHYVKLLDEADLAPRPGVIRLIDEALLRGVALAAASTGAKEAAWAVLRKTLGRERAERFASLKAGDDAPRRKPAPDIYLLALKELGLSARSCVAIEDSAHGLKAAKTAGLWTLATPSQYSMGDDFSLADRVVEDLDRGEIDLDRLDRELEMALGFSKETRRGAVSGGRRDE